MPRSYVTLAEYPSEMVGLACTKCERRGQYRKATLVRHQRFWDSERGKQERLWLVWLVMLCGLLVMQQAALGDSLAFDPFSLQQDCLAAPEVDVGRS